MAPRIRDFVEKFTTTGLSVMIAEAQRVGGIRSFHCGSMETGMPETEFLDSGDEYFIDETNWSYRDHLGAQFQYLVDYESGEITTNVRSEEFEEFLSEGR